MSDGFNAISSVLKSPARVTADEVNLNRIRKVCALVVATLILPALAYAQNNQGDDQGNGGRGIPNGTYVFNITGYFPTGAFVAAVVRTTYTPNKTGSGGTTSSVASYAIFGGPLYTGVTVTVPSRSTKMAACRRPTHRPAPHFKRCILFRTLRPTPIPLRSLRPIPEPLLPGLVREGASLTAAQQSAASVTGCTWASHWHPQRVDDAVHAFGDRCRVHQVRGLAP